MTQAGFPVPPGFVIRTAACAEYFNHDRQFPGELLDEVRQQLDQLGTKTVAVRSGAAVSMPGILETKLDVSPAEFPAAIAAVFESWMFDRAVAYRTTHLLQSLTGTAVVVQEMVPSEAAGVLFTRDPTGNSEDVVLELVRGGGQSIVSGETTPDHFRFSRSDSSAFDSIGFGLSKRHIAELVNLAIRVESLFSEPVDIEWGWTGERFVLFQARPIRSYQLRVRAEQIRVEEIDRLRALANGKRTLWIAHNIGETVFHPTPLEWDVWSQFLSGSGGLGTLYRGLGYRPPPGGFLEIIAGRVFADPQREAEFSGFGLPLTIDLDAVAKDQSHVAPTVDRTKMRMGLLWKLPIALVRLSRVNRRTAEPPEQTVLRFERALNRFEEGQKTETAIRLTDQSIEELLLRIESRRRLVFDVFGPEAVRPGFLCGLAVRRTNDPSHADVQLLLKTRESARSAMTRGLDSFWLAVDELDRRWSAGGGLRFLTLAEIPTYPTNRRTFDAAIAERRMRRDAARLIRLPTVIDSNDLSRLGKDPTLIDSADAVTGTPLSSGSATGTVWIQKEGFPPPGSVVVSESADPSLATFFPHAVAVVVERGGVLSHLAVLAREAGVPAVVYANALDQLKENDRVRIDGSTGRIEKIADIIPRTPQ
ncbi:MAG TPA: PEP/pyruvate-binding domain-containing protein [Fimbriiglobus sp.]|jgi:phosphohistidine swiveling domain-containing protein